MNEPKPGAHYPWREGIFASLAGCLALAYLFHRYLLSGGDAITGDLGDSRLCMVLLEHWWAVCQGLASPRNPNFLAPARDVLGYSTTLFLCAPVYLPLRLLHFDTYTSYQLTLVALRAVGFASAYLMLRRVFVLTASPSVFGAVLFTVANISVRSLGHPQLLNLMFTPVQTLLVWLYFVKRSRRTLAGLAFLTGAMLFTDVYEVFFEGLLVLALIPVWVAVEWWADRESLTRRLRQSSRRGPSDLAFAAPFFLIWLLPFLAVYYPVFRQIGGRPYPEVFSYIRDWREILNVGPNNWLWGRSLGKWFQSWESPVGETGFGITPIMALVTLIATLASVGSLLVRRRLKLQPPDPRLRAIAVVGLAGVALYLVTVHFGIHSLWWLVYHLIPAATGVRVPGRVNALLVLNASVVCALALAWLLSMSPVHWVRWTAAVLVLFVMAEQVNLESTSGICRSSELRYFARFAPPPVACRRFYVVNPRMPRFPFVGQIDGMVLARRLNIATINGFTGEIPSGWDLYYFDDGYRNRVAAYLLANNIWSGTCIADMQSALWTPVRGSEPVFSAGDAVSGQAEISFAANGNAVPFEASGWSSSGSLGTWTNASVAILRVRGLSPDRGNLTIRATALGFCTKSHPEVNVTVLVNDRKVAVWPLRINDSSAERAAEAPAAYLGPPVTTISFDIDDPRSPLELGVSADPRKLGMEMVKLTLTQQR